MEPAGQGRPVGHHTRCDGIDGSLEPAPCLRCWMSGPERDDRTDCKACVALYRRKWSCRIAARKRMGPTPGMDSGTYRTEKRIDKVLGLFVRALLTTLATATVGAVASFFYELFVRPDLYAAGNPVWRGLFVVGLTIPFILGGLLVVGLPIHFILRRLGAENSLTYAIVGVFAGPALGLALFRLAHWDWLALWALYGAATALTWWWLRPTN